MTGLWQAQRGPALGTRPAAPSTPSHRPLPPPRAATAFSCPQRRPARPRGRGRAPRPRRCVGLPERVPLVFPADAQAQPRHLGGVPWRPGLPLACHQQTQPHPRPPPALAVAQGATPGHQPLHPSPTPDRACPAAAAAGQPWRWPTWPGLWCPRCLWCLSRWARRAAGGRLRGGDAARRAAASFAVSGAARSAATSLRSVSTLPSHATPGAAPSCARIAGEGRGPKMAVAGMSWIELVLMAR